MLARGAPRAAAPRDDALVASAREMLVGYPLEYRVLSRIQRDYKPGSVPDFAVAGAAGPNAAQVFVRASGEPLTRGVSGLYTRDGYKKLVLPAIQRATPQLAAEEPWVLGLKADPARLRDAGDALTDKVKRLYFAKYIEAWDKYLADVRLVPLNDPERALAVSRLLSAVDSPLTGYLRGVTDETTLTEEPAAPGALDKLAAQAKGAAVRKARVGKLVGKGGAGAAEGPIEAIVDDHFAGIHRLFEGEPAPIAETQKLFGDLYAQLAAVDAAKKSKSPPPPAGAAAQVKIAAAQQPARGARACSSSSPTPTTGQSRSAEIGGLSAELKPITDICNRAITGRYPFASGSRADVLPEDFGQVFGVGGLLDDFFQRRLAAIVDTSTPTWTYKPLTDGTRPVSPDCAGRLPARAAHPRSLLPRWRQDTGHAHRDAADRARAQPEGTAARHRRPGAEAHHRRAVDHGELAERAHGLGAAAEHGPGQRRAAGAHRRPVGAVPHVRTFPDRALVGAREVQPDHEPGRQARAPRSHLRQCLQSVPAARDQAVPLPGGAVNGAQAMAAPGWHGKLPTLGDFASRRLEAPFIEAWDGWLAAGMLALARGAPRDLARGLPRLAELAFPAHARACFQAPPGAKAGPAC